MPVGMVGGGRAFLGTSPAGGPARWLVPATKKSGGTEDPTCTSSPWVLAGGAVWTPHPSHAPTGLRVAERVPAAGPAPAGQPHTLFLQKGKLRLSEEAT